MKVLEISLSEMPPRKKSAKVTARIQTANAKNSKDTEPEEEEESEKNEEEEEVDLGHLAKADLLAAAVRNAAELADLKKALRTRKASGKSKIVDDDDVAEVEGVSSDDEAEKNKRTSPRKKQQPPPSKLGERAKKIAKTSKVVDAVDPEYEIWKLQRKNAVAAVPLVAVPSEASETCEGISK